MYFAIGIIAVIVSFFAGMKVSSKKSNMIIKGCEKDYFKYRKYYDVLNKWMENVIDGYSLEQYFKDEGIKTIAVYGMGELGNRFIETIDGTDISIVYGIDKNPAVDSEIEVRGFDECDAFDDVDCIVVSAVNVYEPIKKALSKKCSCRIISLEDVIYGL